MEMKSINVKFENSDFRELKKAKKKAEERRGKPISWERFILKEIT